MLNRAGLAYPKNILKRDGSLMPFDAYKIRQAISKANRTIPSETMSDQDLDAITANVVRKLQDADTPGVEQIQDIVELELMSFGVVRTAKAYVLYRAEHAKRRQAANNLMESYKQITFTDSLDSDLKRENANIDGNTAMGTMLKYGSEGAKSFVDNYVLPEDMAHAHADGLIHIHDKDFYMLTATCCQIDLQKLFAHGFSTGHGHLRSPQSIESYAALACIAIQANQNEMHGGQSIPDFDYAMAEGVNKSFRKHLADVRNSLEDLTSVLYYSSSNAENSENAGTELLKKLDGKSYDDLLTMMAELEEGKEEYTLLDIINKRTIRSTNQAMQALIHNLNTMNSRAGAQVPFSSLNYGTDTSEAGRLVIRELLHATWDGLGRGETAIFPVQIFKVKDGINTKPSDKNYDLFKLAVKVSARRLFPNFSFLDAPYNIAFYKEGDSNSEVAYMGCRTRVISNAYDPNHECTKGRGNLSFTSINLVRLGIEARGDLEKFYQSLDQTMELVFRQLRQRFEIQRRKKAKNYPFLMGQGLWLGSEHLEEDEELTEIWKHGTLSLGFIGLAECLVALTGNHHGESNESQKLGLEIITHMRKKCDERTQAELLNYTLLATPAEGLSGRFVNIDRERFGKLPGITDREYYTNSFHIPVYFPISATRKIDLEAPYHALTNAGHISYIEMDGDPLQNLEAFEQLILYMKEREIGYGSINHPIDHDPICGYSGIIGDVCPGCGRKESEGPRFHRIRRITGYLVGTVDRFNDAKRKELFDREKHSL
ncbi:MAG: anaerobic ribonucleoside triphosphate reductase [Clostridiaceae bacterium]|nr:anaerobic ribonucleoside triphosphate reductase [Clostridiaceae bacterium]